jgi:hypothetical protein
VSPQRRDAEGKLHVGLTWENLVERQIREAMESGAFDGLPYQGERLPLEDDSAAGDLAMAHRMLRDARMAPPWIESDKEARRILAELEVAMQRAPRVPVQSRGRERARVTVLIDRANQAIARLNAEAPTPRQHRRPLDPVAELERLERAFGTA